MKIFLVLSALIFAFVSASCYLQNGVQRVCTIKEIFKRSNSYILNYEIDKKEFQDRANCKNNEHFNKVYSEGYNVYCCYNGTHSHLYENEICINKPGINTFIFFLWIIFAGAFFIGFFLITTKLCNRRNTGTSSPFESSTPPPPYPTQTEV